MRKLIAVVLMSLLVASTAFAATCEEQAVDKNGKPLAGAAKNSFMKKCERDNKDETGTAYCEKKAIDKNGKKLAGAAKNSFIKKCESDRKKM